MEHVFNYKAFEKAIDRNLLVFDQDAKPGEFTFRLLALMKLCGRRSVDSKVRFKRIWLPIEIVDFIQDRDIDNEDPHDNIYGEDFGLLPSDVQDKFLNKYNCSLAGSNEKYLCLMEFDNGEYLLGSF